MSAFFGTICLFCGLAWIHPGLALSVIGVSLLGFDFLEFVKKEEAKEKAK